MKKKTAFRSLISTVHLWIGLITGVIVMILGITGCIYSFSEELKHTIYPERYFVPVQGEKKPLSTIIANAQKAVGEQYPLTRGRLYTIPGRSYEFRTLKTDETKFGFWNYFIWYYRVYVNPYTGEIIDVEDAKHSFFDISLGLHTHLLLGRPLGETVIEVTVIFFVVLLVSGLVLWWRKPAYQIKWNARRKRLNYDLHNVVGFYALVPLLLIALTGLGMSFKWTVADLKPLSSDTTKVYRQADDLIYKDALSRHPDAAFIYYNMPPAKTGVITVAAYGTDGKYYDRIADRYDRWSGKRLEAGQTFAEKAFADQLKAVDLDLHTGAAMGLFGRILIFVAGIVATTLPVTGLYIWLNKKKRKKPRRIRTRSNRINQPSI